VKLTDQAYLEMRNAIINLKMKPGERLDTDQIGASLGFSRAPVVEALNMLRAEGLVTSRRRVGTFVSEIGKDQIEDVFDAREMIEHHVAPIIIHNISDRQIEDLAALLETSADLLGAPTQSEFDYSSFMEIDAQFHSRLIGLSERKIYMKWFEELAAHMQRVRHLFDGDALERSIEGNKEHLRIIAALRGRNTDMLRTEMLNHTRRSHKGAMLTLKAD
jgi:DNA-binding GntR family transcriptional regulator